MGRRVVDRGAPRLRRAAHPSVRAQEVAREVGCDPRRLDLAEHDDVREPPACGPSDRLARPLEPIVVIAAVPARARPELRVLEPVVGAVEEVLNVVGDDAGEHASVVFPPGEKAAPPDGQQAVTVAAARATPAAAFRERCLRVILSLRKERQHFLLFCFGTRGLRAELGAGDRLERLLIAARNLEEDLSGIFGGRPSPW